MSAAPRKEVTTREVAAVRFGVMTDDEVRRLSVKRITSPITYDALMHPVPDGLYDPALGPTELHARCATCGLGAAQCPGHFGHVELPVPVYNPLVFGTLYKLVRHACFNCHKLRLGRVEAAGFLARFEALSRGDLAAAAAIRAGRAPKAVRDATEGILAAADEDLVNEPPEERSARLAKLAALDAADHAAPRRLAATCHVQEATRDAVAELFARVPTSKCANCGAASPTVRRQGAAKLFREYSRKALVSNLMRGLDMGDAELARARADGGAMAAARAEAAGGKGGGGKRGGGGGGGKRARGAGGSEEGWTSEEDEDMEGGGGSEEGKEKEEQEQSEDDGSDGGEGDEGDEGKAGVKKMDVDGGAAGGGKGGGAVVSGTARSTAAAARRLDELAGSKFLPPDAVEALITKLCEHEAPLLAHVYGCAAALAGGARPGGRAAVEGAKRLARVFFLRALAVPPNRFRPPSTLGDSKYEHAQNVVLSRIINAGLALQTSADTLAAAAAAGAAGDGAANGAAAALAALSPVQRAAERERFTSAWLRLQGEVNALIDSTTAENADQPGIRQQLEKKEGLFRKNMMGKRVNFAARSVISPDPFIGAGEIGVPPYFASRLSYPEPVTPWNVERLRKLVERGPSYPGAVAVEDEAGRIVQLAPLAPDMRAGLAKRLLSGCPGAGGAPGGGKGGKGAAAAAAAAAAALRSGPQRGWVVYRHLLDGDVMLTNRQPTLHKPGLMAHKARVLKGERAIRLHYANCATFNADFDGDEINLHLPQDAYGRAEGYGIVHADRQYIVPTDGKPIRGLIQDHVVAAVLLTQKDRFLTAAEFSQLLFNAASPWRPGGAEDVALALPAPAVVKPRPLWTGKQLVSALVAVLAKGKPPLTFSAGCKTPASYWGAGAGEGEFVFHRGELVAGVLDKAVFGKFGLVHAMQEAYGGAAAGEMLSALSRLLTLYCQWHGFTCGMDDLLLTPAAEVDRQAVLRRAEAAAVCASAEAAGEPALAPSAAALVAPVGADANAREAARANFMGAALSVADALGDRYRAGRDAAGKLHDSKVTGAMHPLSSEAIKACIPAGQAKPFPANCMSAMTVTGAKGSLVNFSQIAVLLGQQELEGRRVPRMASGKTLPCFRPYDGGARAGGFVGDRFLTGLRPQEYYFHCMAGREGLVDTTVKTSRSGYLQRCLVKNLEALRVGYDHTVRDACDGSVIQFHYGEDGLDVTSVAYLNQHGFVAANAAAAAQALDAADALQGGGAAAAAVAQGARAAEVAAAHAKRAKLLRKAGKGDAGAAARAAELPPVTAAHFPSVLGAVSEAFSDALDAYVAANPDGLLRGAAAGGGGDGSAKKGKGDKKGKGGGSGEVQRVPDAMQVDADDYRGLMLLKFMRSLAAPGEAVGVLAAQSVGEPSTQMTLNTFHMAGRGEANVTLGIPRLREILLTAAARIKTPTLTIPLRAGCGAVEAAALANRMRKLRLAECLKGLRVVETPFAGEGGGGGYQRAYRVRLEFHRMDEYPADAGLEWSELARCFREDFVPGLRKAVAAAIRRAEGGGGVASVSARAIGDGGAGAAAGAGGGGDDEGDEGGAGGSQRATAKKKSDKADDNEDDEPDEELREGKLRFRGGRGEAATYDGPDEEDAEAAEAAERELRRRRGEDVDLDDGGAGGAGGAGGSGSGDADDDEDDGAAANKGGAFGGRKRRPAGSAGATDVSAHADADACACEAELFLSLRAPKLLMLELAERVAAACVVRQVPGIERVHVLDGERGGPPRLQTEGINFVGVWEQAAVLDVDRLVSNDVHAMLVTYGVEAARATVLRECQAVFGAYGIGVDRRHLSLIADFMTHAGGYRPCNRMGIDTCTSPLLKMSFETAARFLTDAALAGAADPLRSPAARLCAGGVAGVGTGCCDVLMDVVSARG